MTFGQAVERVGPPISKSDPKTHASRMYDSHGTVSHRAEIRTTFDRAFKPRENVIEPKGVAAQVTVLSTQPILAGFRRWQQHHPRHQGTTTASD